MYDSPGGSRLQYYCIGRGLYKTRGSQERETRLDNDDEDEVIVEVDAPAPAPGEVPEDDATTATEATLDTAQRDSMAEYEAREKRKSDLEDARKAKGRTRSRKPTPPSSRRNKRGATPRCARPKLWK